ncbi:MAG: DUF378 domain-containing protein [Comamonadaceae bacterium]|nr:MAG: DUF378 domain-containing protein [Comamonadaceae bacterium]
MATSTSTNVPLTTQSSLSAIDWIALVLMIIGSINWGLVGAFNLDLVAAIFGSGTMPARIVYILVGLAGLYGISLPFRLRPRV